MTDSLKQRVSLAGRVLLGKSIPRQARQEIPAITPQEVAEARQFFPLDKFFIFGHARSGTTVLARLIRLHPEVHCNYQAHFFTRPPLLQALVSDQEVGDWLARGSNRWNQGKDLSPLVLRAAADFILERQARQEGKRIVGDKSPNSLLDGQSVEFMRRVYPDARLIYIVRDGRDTAISHRFQAFIDFPEHLSQEDLRIRDDFASNPDPFLRGERSIFTEKAIHRAAEGWVRNVQETDRLGREHYGERYGSLRYEDLLARPWGEMQRMWSFLGASPPAPDLESTLTAELDQNPDADWQQQKAKEIAQPLQKGKQGAWQELFSARDRQVFQQIAGETLAAWGYTNGRS
ncbi:MAG: sulfotransferase [Anaerolineales bacterium]|nr:sulfotransferase [Anaerolineales bacterium]